MNSVRTPERPWLPVFVLALYWAVGMAAGQAQAAEHAELDVHGAIESFTWKEFNNGTRLLKESGALTGVGVSLRVELPEQLTFEGSADIFAATRVCIANLCVPAVDYQGATQSGVPTTSTVDYLGVKLKADGGLNLSMDGPYTLEPFAGFGYRFWFRHIRNGTTSAGQPVQGYTEQWQTLYARMGVRSSLNLSESNSLFAEAGLRLPVYNENLAYFSREGIGPDITMHPGVEWSPFAEAGMKMDRVKAVVYYDSLRFSRSPGVIVFDAASQKNVIFFQPRSTADIYGVRVGVLF